MTELKVLSEDVTIASIDWHREDVPTKVLVANLERVRQRGK